MMKHLHMKRTGWRSRLFCRLISLPVAMLFLVLSAQAQTDVIMPNIGGTGGGQFVARCPQGQHLTGFELRTGDDVDAIRPLCITAYGPADTGPIEPYPSKFGGEGDTRQLVCPRDAPIVIGMFVKYEGITVVVNSIHLFCGVAAVTQTPSILPNAVFDGPVYTGSKYSAYLNRSNKQYCPDGLVAVGINGRSGKWLDSVGLICGAPRLTPRATPPPEEAATKSGVKTFGRVKIAERPAFIYAVANDSTLKWFRHDGASEGKFDWEGPRVVNVDWGNFKQVFPGGSGTIYAITQRGILMRYQHAGFSNGLGKDDPKGWEVPQNIATGWGNYRQAFSAGNGIIYAITQDGKLNWYKHTGFTNGKATWEGPKDVGRGWGDAKQVLSIGEGIIYAITSDGKLNWFRHNGYMTGDGLEKPGAWTGPKEVGTGWGDFQRVFSTSEGIIYGITPEGKLMWYHHRGYKDGKVAWDGAREVGRGWDELMNVFAQF